MQKFILLFSLVLCVYSSQAQSFWTKVEKTQIISRTNEERTIIPEKYETFRLDLIGLKNYLRLAPQEMDRATAKGLILEIPLPNGRLEKFLVYESPVMEPLLAAKFPSIKSYIAAHAIDRTKHMRFAVSPSGFHAAIECLDGEKYIDPYSSINHDDYIVYNVKDHKSDAYKNMPLCGNNDVNRENNSQGLFNPIKSRAAEVDLRVFKLAMACTGEWGTKRGTVAACLADINVMLNRMNAIYERELAARFVLINDNDKLIFIDPATDPYNNSDQGKLILPTNTGVINARITGGSSAYDIGHVLSVCFDIGGVAQLGSLCQSNKGNGVTCHNNNDLSGIVTRVMAHEVGHQFDASHTWNICPGIEDQRSDANAYEPGSGTTIMSYAGSCGPNDVASDNDDYFHIRSLEQMYAKTYSGGNASNCSDKVPTGNHFPVITMPSKVYTIPITTPFELRGSATDEDNDNLTYCWEQYDLGQSVVLGSNTVTGPLFRSFKPSALGHTRFVPEPANILTGKLTDKKEVLPDKTRVLNWKFTARDNHAGGGGVQWDDYRVNVSDAAGPFKLIYPYLDDKFVIGQEVNVTWEVANTDKAPINCQFVNIFGSYNGALREGDANLVPLALNVPNDGTQTVYIPNRTTNIFRIVIKAADNIFLTSSIIPSRINEPTSPTVFFDAPSFIQVCQPNPAVVDVKAIGFGGLTENINFEIIGGVPAGVNASFANASVAPGSSTTLTINTGSLLGSQTSDILIRAWVEGVDTIERAITFEFVGGDINNIGTISPENGGVAGALPKYTWNDKTDASSFRIQVAKDPAFSNIISNAVVIDTTYTSNTILDANTVYYWRVIGINKCGEGNAAITKAFKTEAFACFTYEEVDKNIAISGAGMPEVSFPTEVSVDGIISDINIKSIRGEHSRIGDLAAYLVAPSGKEVLLWNRKCGTSQNVNVAIDDQSPAFFACPINTGKTYRPEGKLSDLNGESSKGTWRLKVQDLASGSGGKLIDFKLELCSSITLKNPYLVKNEILKIYPGDIRPINNISLLVGDDDNTADQLTYKLVSVPTKGDVYFNGQKLGLGASFTQADIDAGKIDYKSTGTTDDVDKFDFVVLDNAGGWLSITSYNIDINKGNPSDVSETELQAGFNIYPNPTSGQVFIIRNETLVAFDKFTVTDLAGRILTQGRLTDINNSLSLDQLTTGAYVIRLTDGSRSVAKKLIKL
jgi:subtilisin-like proprotein convertase family protein